MRVLLALALLLAGCTGTTPEPDAAGPEWPRLALDHGEHHDHMDRFQHQNNTTPNFRALGHEPMVSGHYGQNAGGYLCGDVQETQDGRRIAAVESRSDVGFALVDVTDPARPQWLGELVMPNSYVYDLAVVPDGKHVVLVTHAAKGPDVPPPLAHGVPPSTLHPHDGVAGAADGLTWIRCGQQRPVVDHAGNPAVLPAPDSHAPAPCPAEPDPLPREQAILLVDIQDPEAPRVVDHQPLLGYGHSAFSTELDGRLLVLAVTQGPDLLSSWAHFYEVQDGEVARLQLLSAYRSPLDEGAQGLQRHLWHDGWIAEHPVTGQRLAHLVGGHDHHMLDLADPTRPEVVGRWDDRDPEAGAWTGKLHSVLPLDEVWDGRHYTVIGPEFVARPEDHPSGIVRVLDTTDTTTPFEVAAWTLPVDVVWDEGQAYQFSNHYFTVEGRTLFVSMYHGGVWAVDLSPVGEAEWVNLPSIGVWQPTADVEAAHPVRWAPTNQEVFVHDGVVLTFDANTGLHTAVWDPTVEVPVPEPWPLRPVRG